MKSHRSKSLALKRGERKSTVVRSARCRRVVRDFGLDDSSSVSGPASTLHGLSLDALSAPGTITLITGPSGSGKSRLLADLLKQPSQTRVLNLQKLAMKNKPLIDCLASLDIRQALLLLGRVGLGEVWSYIKTPTQLSAGQRWRFRMALALEQVLLSPDQRTVLVADEFAAVLDRVTAMVVARALRRAIDAAKRSNRALGAIVATSHDDLSVALRPDTIVHCDFASIRVDRTSFLKRPSVEVDYHSALAAPQASRVEERADKSAATRISPSPGTPEEGQGEGRGERDDRGECEHEEAHQKSPMSPRASNLARRIPIALLAGALVIGSHLSTFARDNDSIFDRRDDDLITERRDDDLIEPLDRPLDHEPTLMQRTEDALDRGEGRLKDEALYELDRLSDQLRAERMFDGFEEDRDRALRIEAQKRKEKRADERKIYERESDRLAPERQAYLRAIGRASDAASAGAADDFRKLSELREAYERDMKTLASGGDRARRTREYESARDEILGIDSPPATQPTTVPASAPTS